VESARARAAFWDSLCRGLLDVCAELTVGDATSCRLKGFGAPCCVPSASLPYPKRKLSPVKASITHPHAAAVTEQAGGPPGWLSIF
jgi:hypothetical protein